MNDRTYYDVIEVAPTATPDQIKEAYRIMAGVWHPDRFKPGTRQHGRAVERMKEINAVYEVLRDPRKRELYDQELGRQRASSRPDEAPPPQPAPPPGGGGRQPASSRPEEAPPVAKLSSTKLMVAAILGFFLYGTIASMLGTLLPDLSVRDHFGPAQMGDVALVQALGLMIASIVTGPLIDNRGKKTGMILGLVLIVISLIGLPASTGWLMVAASMFLLGLGGGTIVNAANMLVSDLSEQRRASFFSLAHIFFCAGGIFTPLVAANFLAGNGIRLSILVAGIAVVVTVITVFIAMPPPTRERAFGLSAALDLKGKPLLVLLSFFVFLYASCEVGFWNWLPKYMISEGISQKTALNILALGFASGMLVGRMIAVKVLVKVRASSAALFCAVLMVGVMFWALRSPSPTMAWISVFCSGLVMGPVFSSSMAMTGDAFPVMTATCLGIVTTAGWAGTAVSSYVVGAIAGQEVSRLRTALLIFPAFAVIMVLIGVVLQPMLRKPRPAASVAA